VTFDATLDERLDFVADEYSKSGIPWVIGFSGGKDSSLVVKIVFEALSRLRRRQTALHVVYCDTGVEIPIVAAFIRKTLTGIELQARQSNIPITCHLATPRLRDRFFVRVIGRGYPPPTNKFRWCTDVLRIDPIRRLMARVAGARNLVVLGVRQAESEERKRVLARHSTSRTFYYHQSQSENRQLFCPIVDFDADAVWEGLFRLPRPEAIDVHRLSDLYKQASGECPVVREVKGSPCGQGRFGCWTCTVVRKDRAVQGLVQEGHTNLRPLLEFRDWLMSVRDNPDFRCGARRNGAAGPGPFRLDARKAILKRLLTAQRRSGFRLISRCEIEMITSLWAQDRANPKYLDSKLTTPRFVRIKSVQTGV
jgi:DNA sulfur modification protein DndC